MKKKAEVSSYDVYEFNGEFQFEELVDKLNEKDKIDLNGTLVNFKSLRLKTFIKKGNTCVKCGRVGSIFRLQRPKKNGKDLNKEAYHVGLWSDDKVQMTKDHIIPKSKGGKDYLGNMQCMCEACNMEKGNTDDKDFMPSKIKITLEELSSYVTNYLKEYWKECKSLGLTCEEDSDSCEIDEIFFIEREGKKYGFLLNYLGGSKIIVDISEDSVYEDGTTSSDASLIEGLIGDNKFEYFDQDDSTDENFNKNLEVYPNQEFEMHEIFLEEYTEIIPERRVKKQRWVIKGEK